MPRHGPMSSLNIDILRFIKDAGPVGSGIIADEFNITPQSAHNRLYGYFEREGYVESKHYQNKDGKWCRRANTAMITERGRRFLDEI